MTEPDPLLAGLQTADLDPERVARMRRRGQRVLGSPAAGPLVRVEITLVGSFSVMMLCWAAAAVVRLG